MILKTLVYHVSLDSDLFYHFIRVLLPHSDDMQ